MKSIFLFVNLRNYQDILLNRDKNKKYFLFRKKNGLEKSSSVLEVMLCSVFLSSETSAGFFHINFAEGLPEWGLCQRTGSLNAMTRKKLM